MISKRFKYDSRSVLFLNTIQKQARDNINDRIKKKEYEFEIIPCPICDSINNDTLSEKDRYGLFMSSVMCKTCGLVYTNPRMTGSSYEKFYELDQKLLYTGKEKPDGAYFDRQVSRGVSIITFLYGGVSSVPDGLNVMEVGCSSGGILKAFKDSGANVFGCDINKEYVKYGRDKGLILEAGTIKDVEIPWYPDVIIYSHTLEHVMDPIRELKNLKAISSNKTRLYIEVPGIKNLWRSYGRDFLHYLQNAHTFHFSLRTLMNFASLSGWSLVYGDETIRATFRSSDISIEYKEDTGVLNYLKRMEIYRLIPSPYRIRYLIKNG